MKKSLFVTIIVIALVISMLPFSSALAKREVGTVEIEIRNQTGAPMSIIITDNFGLYSHIYFYEPGVWYLNIQKGSYVYHASTACGTISSSANFDRVKKLAFHCRAGVNSSLYRQAHSKVY